LPPGEEAPPVPGQAFARQDLPRCLTLRSLDESDGDVVPPSSQYEASMLSTCFARSTALFCAAVLSGCANIQSGADFPLGLRLDQYQTFTWGAGDTLPAGDPRLDNNPFFDARVRAAVELELAAHGLRRVSSAPDLLVHYHASVRQRTDVVRADEARGYTNMEMRASEQVIQFDEGTLIVDVADAKSKVVLWRGWSQTDVGGLLADPREMEKRINSSVRQMMQRFPRAPA
jgi:Domain of unknown function (DUF4136)